ncbi:MAG: hypothetical protein ACRDSH_21815 [Pseudonocardiaceae bacterium]
MTERLAQLDVRIEAEPDADCEELMALAVRLRAWLLPVGVEPVGFVVAGSRSAGGVRCGCVDCPVCAVFGIVGEAD